MRNVLDAPAILLIGSDPTYQHPLLAWQIRNNVRLHRSRLYLINARPIKLTRQATHFVQVAGGAEGKAVAFLAGDDNAREHCALDESGRDKLSALRDKLRTENDLIIVYGSELRGEDIAMLVQVGAAGDGVIRCALARGSAFKPAAPASSPRGRRVSSLTLIWQDSREFGRTSKPKSSMSSSIGDGPPTLVAPRLIDIDVACRTGAGSAAFGFDPGNGVADRRFHHCGAVFDVNSTGFAVMVDKADLGHDCSC